MIRAWAEARDGHPATMPGTGHGGHLGVLRIEFEEGDPDPRDDRRLAHVSWEQRGGAFTARGLLDGPGREDG